MSDIVLTHAETPLAWPVSVPLSDIKSCSTCGIKIISPTPGTLQIQSRRKRGVGDGVNIDESAGAGADYRGQRYTYKEAIFHTPGLHIFPGQKDVYPAEYHIHMHTMKEPIRYITLVIPVSHNIEGPTQAYFKAMKKSPDPTAIRPTLESLVATLDGPMLQYRGPDIRNRVRDLSGGALSTEERQFLLVLQPASIRAADLERIPSIDGTVTDPRDYPAPGIEPKIKAISRDRLTRTTVLASPGILHPKVEAQKAKLPNELEIKPIKVVDGRMVVDMSGTPVDIKELLGLSPQKTESSSSGSGPSDPTMIIFLLIEIFAVLIGFVIGIVLTDMLWKIPFKGGNVSVWEPLKIWFLPVIFGGVVYSVNRLPR